MDFPKNEPTRVVPRGRDRADPGLELICRNVWTRRRFACKVRRPGPRTDVVPMR